MVMGKLGMSVNQHVMCFKETRSFVDCTALAGEVVIEGVGGKSLG